VVEIQRDAGILDTYQRQAAAIIKRAERQLGTLLIEMEERGTRRRREGKRYNYEV
jgi:hypothetical protein